MVGRVFSSLLSHCETREDSRGDLKVLYESGNVILKRSFSRKGVFRGMHLQRAPYQQTKLIRVISGRVIDFIADPHDESKLLHWTLVDSASDWILIGPDFAHGFYALEDTVFEYICDGAYCEEAEESYSITGILAEVLEIEHLILSKKDESAKPLDVVPSRESLKIEIGIK